MFRNVCGIGQCTEANGEEEPLQFLDPHAQDCQSGLKGEENQQAFLQAVWHGEEKWMHIHLIYILMIHLHRDYQICSA